MPSIKKRVTGFIRQLSAPNAAGPHHHHHHHHEENGHHQVKGSKSHPGPGKIKGNTRGGGNHHNGEAGPAGPTDSVGFIQKYFQNGALHESGPAILSGKTGQDLPAHRLSPSNFDLEVFAAFTGPEGGITSICNTATGSSSNGHTRNKFRQDAAEDSEDFDYIDLEDLNNPAAIARRNSRKQGPNNSSATNSSDKENKTPNEKNSRPRRELSVETDYPELGGDFNFGGLSNNSPPPLNSSQKSSSSSSKTLNSSIYVNQMISRRLKLDLRNDTETTIAGIRHWYRPNNAATGLAVTLYERHPFTAEHAGNPIADTFSVVARKNSAILVLGDGVNWGTKAALASRCAVSGCMEYLNSALFSTPQQQQQSGSTMTTQEVFQILLRSFNAAHSLILQEEAQLTTLTACVVIPVKVDGEDEEKFVACCCNVGDSLAYVYSPSSGHVREITQDSHDITSNRDMRDALGALGPVDGINPELSNLTYSMTFVNPTDIVFITSDGVSDNFDPVVGKFCVPLKSDGRRAPASLPAVEAYQRHDLTLLRMEDILNHGSGSTSSQSIPSSSSSSSVVSSASSSGSVRTSAELCHRMVDFCQRLTTAKRKILEDPELYPDHTRHALPDSDATRLDQKMRRRKVCEKLAMVPGKLDHATIVAYTVDDRRKSLQQYRGTLSSPIFEIPPETCSTTCVAPNDAAAVPLASVGGSLRAPCASTEDLTLKDDLSEDGDQNAAGEDADPDRTPTPSESLCSTPSLNCGSLAVTPVHHPKQDIDLCFKGGSNGGGKDRAA